MDATTLSAELILGIPLDAPERLFSPDLDLMKKERNRLLMAWHPDACSDPKATEVSAWVNQLYQTAQYKLQSGTWNGPGTDKQWIGLDGKYRRLKVIRQFECELGTTYLSRLHLAVETSRENKALITNGLTWLQTLGYANEGMRQMMEPNFPAAKRLFHTKEHTVGLLERNPETVRLTDLLNYVGGAMDPRHVAWVTSRLLNIACYLDWMQISHNAINLENVYIVPSTHQVCLYGGWWYAERRGKTLKYLPATTVRNMPSHLLRNKVASIKIDLSLIRHLGTQLLGGHSAPEPMEKWLRSPTPEKAHPDYLNWTKVLSAAFGERKFVKLDIAAKDVYGE